MFYNESRFGTMLVELVEWQVDLPGAKVNDGSKWLQ